MNVYDSELIAGLLEKCGYQETKEISNADAIFLNTCAIREKAPINLLKLGVSMVQIGEKDQGCKMINGVEKQYPEANQSVIQKAKYESQKFECNNQNS